jgi:hypothetical protein
MQIQPCKIHFFPNNDITEETQSNFSPSHDLFDDSLPFETSFDQESFTNLDYSKLSNLNHHDVDTLSPLAEHTVSHNGGLFSQPLPSTSSGPRIITVENPVRSSSIRKMLDALPKNIPHLDSVIKACQDYPTLSLAGRARKIGMDDSIFHQVYSEYKLHTIFDAPAKKQQLQPEKQDDIIRNLISKAFPNRNRSRGKGSSYKELAVY